MVGRLGVSSLVPRGLVVEMVERAGEAIIVTARAGGRVAQCPACSANARRVHSRYVRHTADLPTGLSRDDSDARRQDADAAYLPSASAQRSWLPEAGVQAAWR